MTHLKSAFGLLGLALLLLPISAAAQEVPQVEIFGGYSYLRLAPTLNDPTLNFPANDNHGYHVSLLANLTKHFGIAVEFARHQGSKTVQANELGGLVPPNTSANTSVSYRLKSANLVFGPRFSARTARTTVFGQVLMGAARTDAAITTPVPDLFDTDGTVAGVAIAAGGGLDVNIHRLVAFRVVQAEYLRILHIPRSLGAQNNLQISTGLVLRFGKK